MDCPLCQKVPDLDQRPDIKDGKECQNYSFSALAPILDLSFHRCQVQISLSCGHQIPKYKKGECIGWARCQDWRPRSKIKDFLKLFKI
jgi:hypothetical protein